MDEETTCIAFVPVPAPEIIGTVGGVKGPFEVDGSHFADSSLAFPEM